MSIEHLDFDMTCPCGATATQAVVIHAVDYCTPNDQTWAAALCAGCMGRLVTLASQLCGAFCGSCMFPFVTVSDVIVRQCPLEQRNPMK